LLIATSLLSGCSSTYRAAYISNCHATDGNLKERIDSIVSELSRKLGATPQRTPAGSNAIQFHIIVPYPMDEKPANESAGNGAAGEITATAYDGKITIAIMTGGSGAGASTERIRKSVEETFADNSCGEWTFENHVSTFDLK
jgi:hypothetical protein